MQIKRIYLGFEFILLFFVIPLFLYLFPEIVFRPIAFLLPLVLLIFFYLYRAPGFKFMELLKLNIDRKIWFKNLLTIVITGILMLLSVWYFDPANLFNLPRMNLRLWFMLCIFYPLFSASIQEIIFKTFFFRRYRELFRSKTTLIIGSGISFGFMHIVYYSWISMSLSFFMGIYLAMVYEKTGSVLFITILHGIFGIMAFSFGLGQYFWLDMFEYINKF